MAAVGGIVLIVSPEGIRSGIKKHIRLICSLCVLCVMISPLHSLFESLGEIGGRVNSTDEDILYGVYESIYNESSEKIYGEGIERAVKQRLAEGLDIPADQCRTAVEFSDSDGDGFGEPKKITVILSGRSIFKDPRQVEALISGEFQCECVCAIE